MYIHESLHNKYTNDKKLNLLKSGVINFTQFINLIESDDPYTLIGPALVAKDAVNTFISEWKNSTINLKTLTEEFIQDISPKTIIEKLPALNELFPEITDLVKEFNLKLESVTCTACVKNKYIVAIINEIKKYYKDGRDLKEEEQFITSIIEKYFPLHNKIVSNDNLNEFDINWIKPDTLVGIGDDLIMGLTNCFNCCKKHIGRAKAFYEEWQQRLSRS